jgi:hypothetical protein
VIHDERHIRVAAGDDRDLERMGGGTGGVDRNRYPVGAGDFDERVDRRVEDAIAV